MQSVACWLVQWWSRAKADKAIVLMAKASGILARMSGMSRYWACDDWGHPLVQAVLGEPSRLKLSCFDYWRYKGMRMVEGCLFATFSIDRLLSYG
jgi:hypothetical protein